MYLRNKKYALVLLLLNVVFYMSISPVVGAVSYKISSGDVLKITVFGEDDISGKFTVDADGKIRIAWIPPFRAAGLTIPEFRKKLTHILASDYIRNPRVSVEILEYGGKGVKILGEVGKPGRYPLTGDGSLLRLLIDAGGPKATASEQVLVMRFSSEGKQGPITFSVDRERLMRGDKSVDIKLAEGDVVYLPPRKGNGNMTAGKAVFVFGAVKNIGAYPYRKGYTVLNAISDAHGFTKFASPNKARIIRNTSKGKETIKVKLGDLMKKGGKGKVPEMLPGDILYVPESFL